MAVTLPNVRLEDTTKKQLGTKITLKLLTLISLMLTDTKAQYLQTIQVIYSRTNLIH